MPIPPPQNDTDRSAAPIPSILIDQHNDRPSAETADALQCAVVAACYQNKTTQGKHSGGKTGSEAFYCSTHDGRDIIFSSYCRSRRQSRKLYCSPRR